MLLLAIGQNERLGAACWLRHFTVDILELIWGFCAFNISAYELYTPQHQHLIASALGMSTVYKASGMDMITALAKQLTSNYF